MIDVVIPVWNEEAWLDRLLTRLKTSSLIETIFVVDNNSSDRSRDIARSHGCIVLEGGRPARARNAGAACADADLLLFVDADTIMTESTIRSVLIAFNDPQVAAVHFRNVPLTKSRTIKFLYVLMHCYLLTIERLGISQGIGTAIAVRASVMRRLGGFREEIAVGEDADFLRRASYVGKVRYLTRSVVFTSARRLDVEGRLVFVGKVALWSILRLLKTRISIIEYSWQPYRPEAVIAENALVLELGL